MYDKELTREILKKILKSANTIRCRFEPVKEVKDFTDSPSGMEKLDSICMQLVVIGESLKQIDKITDKSLLVNYPEVNWKGAKAMRDIIGHHYFEIDAEIIYSVCKDKMGTLRDTIKRILNELQ
jgi:uncharacterized protein with HEPN domain